MLAFRQVDPRNRSMSETTNSGYRQKMQEALQQHQENDEIVWKVEICLCEGGKHVFEPRDPSKSAFGPDARISDDEIKAIMEKIDAFGDLRMAISSIEITYS